jgi:hypothetical protein
MSEIFTLKLSSRNKTGAGVSFLSGEPDIQDAFHKLRSHAINLPEKPILTIHLRRRMYGGEQISKSFSLLP